MITFDFNKLTDQFDNRFYLVLAIVDRVKLLKRGVPAKVERRGRDLISVAIQEFTEGHLTWNVEDNYFRERAEELAKRAEIGERDLSESFFEDDDFAGDEFFDEAFDDLDLERDTKKKAKKKVKADDDDDDDGDDDGDDDDGDSDDDEAEVEEDADDDADGDAETEGDDVEETDDGDDDDTDD